MVILLMGELCCPQVNAIKVYFTQCNIFLYYDGHLVILFHIWQHIYLHMSKVLIQAPVSHISLGDITMVTEIGKQFVHGCYMFESLSDSDY